MSLNAQAPFLSVYIWPVGSAPGNRTQWTLSENYAGFFQTGSDGDGNDGAGVPDFRSLQYPNQPAFIDPQGDIEFVRFTGAGRVERGVPAALQSNPDSELCGLTIRLRLETRQNRMRKEPHVSLAPQLPANVPVLYWVSEGGEWETVMPARTPQEGCVHPYAAPPNKAIKIKTEKPWDENRGFVMVCDFAGTIYNHSGEGAVRLLWGDKWSLVFRGQGTKNRPTLERKTAKGWECVRVLRDCAPLDQTFWTSSHTVSVHRLGGRLCIAVDGVEYAISETASRGEEQAPAEATWPRAPLRISVWGAEAMFHAAPFTGDAATPDAKGRTSPLQASFSRKVPAPGTPPTSNLTFTAHGNGLSRQIFDVPGANEYLPPSQFSVKSLMQGTGLNGVSISGSWSDTTVDYAVSMQCTSTTPPLLCGLVCEFAPLPSAASSSPIELRPALTSLSVDSGDPEELPDAEASFSLSYALLEQLIPHWKLAVLPYRLVLIRAKQRATDDWTTLFKGFLTPDSASRGGWNDHELPLVARGPLLRLSQPAALIDERFGPLDLQMATGRSELWGAEAAQNLLRIELGEEWTYNFNGTGEPLAYFPSSHYPLLSNEGPGFFISTLTPLSGNWRLPPPFGSDLKTWLDTLAKFDYAVWFYDHAEEAFFYGRILEFVRERRKKSWGVPETAPPPEVTTTFEWPLLSSLSQSGLLERAINDVRVWGTDAKGGEGLSPSFIMGRAGDSEALSLDPLSIAQSWRRTLLQKPEFAKEGVIDNDYADDLAYNIWQGLKGRLPVKMDAEFETGFLGPRWGEILHLPTGFDGPAHHMPHHPDNLPKDGLSQDWVILRVKHNFDFSGSENRFSTTLSARPLSAQGL